MSVVSRSAALQTFLTLRCSRVELAVRLVCDTAFSMVKTAGDVTQRGLWRKGLVMEGKAAALEQNISRVPGVRTHSFQSFIIFVVPIGGCSINSKVIGVILLDRGVPLCCHNSKYNFILRVAFQKAWQSTFYSSKLFLHVWRISEDI